MLNGKKLNGSMMATLAESYVVAINNGAVPNIETAWSYICKSECQKALDDSLKIAESIFGQEAIRLPMNEEDIRSIIKSAKN